MAKISLPHLLVWSFLLLCPVIDQNIALAKETLAQSPPVVNHQPWMEETWYQHPQGKWQYRFGIKIGKRFSLCRDMVDNFKTLVQSRAEFPPYHMSCGVELHPDYRPLFNLPKSEPMDPKKDVLHRLREQLRVSKMAEVQSRSNPPPEMIKALEDEVEKRYQISADWILKKINESGGKGLTRIWIDADFDGIRDEIHQYNEYPDCDPTKDNLSTRQNFRYTSTSYYKVMPGTQNYSVRFAHDQFSISRGSYYFFYRGRTYTYTWHGRTDYYWNSKVEGYPGPIKHAGREFFRRNQRGSPKSAYLRIHEPWTELSSSNNIFSSRNYPICDIDFEFKRKQP